MFPGSFLSLTPFPHQLEFKVLPRTFLLLLVSCILSWFLSSPMAWDKRDLEDHLVLQAVKRKLHSLHLLRESAQRRVVTWPRMHSGRREIRIRSAFSASTSISVRKLSFLCISLQEGGTWMPSRSVRRAGQLWMIMKR